MEPVKTDINTAAMEDPNNPMSEADFSAEYIRPSIRMGSWTMGIAFFTSFIPAIGLWIIYGVVPSLSQIIMMIGLIASASVAWWIVEPLSYFPVLGTAGCYMAFVCGSAKDRLPCAIAAQEATNAQPGTQKGEMMATLGIAGTVVTSLTFVAIGAIGGTALLNALPAGASGLFQYVPNAIYGAMLATFLLKRPELAIFSLLTTLFLVKIGVLFIPSFLLMLINVVLCVAFAIVLYKKWGRK